MTAAAPVAAPVLGPLSTAVARRSPSVLAALDPAEARARASAWAARAVPGAGVDEVRVRSVLYRPDGSCTLRYHLRLAPTGREQVLLVAVPASGDGTGVRAFPDDPGLPTLPRAVDPVHMRGVLGRVVPGTGGDRAVGRCAVDVVHHPRQGRCVLRYRLSVGAGGQGELRHPVVFGKVYGDDSAASAASALRVLRNGLRVSRGPVRVDVPRPLAVVASLRLGLVEALPGRPDLPELLKAACDAGGPAPRLSDAVDDAARAAAAVHGCETAGTRLPVRDLAAEHAATERELAALEPVWPDVAAYLRERVAGAPAAAARSGWPLSPVVAHGDLTPGQLLRGETGGVGIVDVDTLCLAEPALDLGRFVAYLQVAGLRRSAAAWPLLADLTGRFLDSYVDACPATDARLLRARTEAYRVLALARIGASACWQLKDHRLRAAIGVLDAGTTG